MKLAPEDEHIEYKASQKALSKDVWETYSAFANTEGGTIVLGVAEEKGDFRIVGVDSVEMLLHDFWVTINNSQKISKNILDNRNIIVVKHEGKDCIHIEVPEAHVEDKPIYLNSNPANTYIRRYSSDQKAKEEEVAILMRDKSGNQDGVLLDHYGLSDLHKPTIQKYREYLVQYTKDESLWAKSDEELLLMLGVLGRDRVNGAEVKLTVGGLLFFGTEEAIRSRFPHFHIDYFDYRDAKERWSDRIAFADMLYPDLNLFAYYLAVITKLNQTVKEPFKLNGSLMRISKAHMQKALREACINMLVNADYHRTLTNACIRVYTMNYVFENTGRLLVSKAEFMQGGKSKPRNSVIASLFRRIGASERAGSGGPLIFSLPEEYDFKMPQLEGDLYETKLTIWSVEPINAIESITEEEKAIYDLICHYDGISGNQIAKELNLSRYKVSRMMDTLIGYHLVIQEGAGRSRLYKKATSTIEKLMELERLKKSVEWELRAKEN